MLKQGESMYNINMPTNLANQFDAVFLMDQKEVISMPDVEVTICHTLATVTLKDRSNCNPDVILKGESAKNFHNAFKVMQKENPNLSVPTAMGMLSAPYVGHWK